MSHNLELSGDELTLVRDALNIPWSSKKTMGYKLLNRINKYIEKENSWKQPEKE